MDVKYLGCLVLAVAASGGCGCGCVLKHESELNCPTDIRQTVPWCAGEDAIFCCPCGPDRDFYGHKPTCWRAWPTPAETWREAHCGPLVLDASVPDQESLPTPAPGTPTPESGSAMLEFPESSPALDQSTSAVDESTPVFVELAPPSNERRPDFSQLMQPVRPPTTNADASPPVGSQRLRDTILSAARELDDGP